MPSMGTYTANAMVEPLGWVKITTLPTEIVVLRSNIELLEVAQQSPSINRPMSCQGSVGTKAKTMNRDSLLRL